MTITNNKMFELSQEIAVLLKDAEGRYEHFPCIGMDALRLAALAQSIGLRTSHVSTQPRPKTQLPSCPLRNLASLLVKQMVHPETRPLAHNQIFDGFG